MTTLAQRNFSGGEIAPSLYARVDQARYASGLRTMRNMMTMRHGGATNRPGTKFVGEVSDSDRTVRLIPFIFNVDQTYVLEFGDGYIRFIQDGAYLLEAAKTITAATKANPVVVTSAAHGFSNGDEVVITVTPAFGSTSMTELNGRNYKVANVTTDTFELNHMDGTTVNGVAFTTYTSGGTVQRVYTVVSPYAESALPDLQFVQSADVVTIVHPDYAPQELSRLDQLSWTLTEISIVPGVSAPGSPANNGGGSGTTFWVITALKEETFEESLPSTATSSSATPTGGAPITVSWAAVTGAVQYNIYKRTNGVYGFIGTAAGTSFIDNGITPDATATPPSQSLLVQDVLFSLSKLANPATLPPTQGRSCCWSHNMDYLVVGTGATPFITIYKRTGTTLTKLTDPATLPPFTAFGVAFSPDDQFLAVAHDTSPYITIYQRSGDTFTKLADPASLPTGQGHSVAWSADGQFLAIAHATSPFVTIYQVTGTTFTKLSNPATLPTGAGNGVSFSSDGQFLAVSHVTSPFLTIYQISGTTFTKLTNPASLPPGAGVGCAFSPDTDFLAVGSTTTPFLIIYQRNGAVFTKLTDPATMPTGNGAGVAWTSNGAFLSIAHSVTPYITIYQHNGTTFTKLSDPSTLPAGLGGGLAWTDDDTLLAIVHDTTPFVTVYEDVSSPPAAVGYYQQRLLFAASDAKPEKLWASKSGAFKNFTISSPIQDDDAVIFGIAGRQVNRIIHMVELSKLILLTSGGEWTVEGDAAGILRPGEINPKQHSYNGASKLRPIVSGGNALYVQARGSIVRDLGFDFQIEGYRGNDLTVFSAHLFDGHTLVDWDYQKTPNSIIWAVRDDGVLLGLTYVQEQQILAWHRHDFDDGFVENVCVVPEGNEDAVYVVVRRTVDGVTKRYVERLETRLVTDIVDAIFMDSALTYDGRNESDTTMTLSGGTAWTFAEVLTLTASANFFRSTDVGNAIHLTGADGTLIRFTIEGFTSATVVTGKAHKTVPAGMRAVAVTEWAKAVDQLSGLWHLEGKDVSVFADGFVVASPKNTADFTTVITVENGAITLPRPYAVIHVGLPYLSDLETLDIDSPQGESISDKKKIVTNLAAFVEATRGIYAGAAPPTDDDVDPLQNLLQIKMRNSEGYDQPTALRTEVMNLPIQGNWNSNGRVFIRQIDPLPLSILSLVPSGLFPFRG